MVKVAREEVPLVSVPTDDDMNNDDIHLISVDDSREKSFHSFSARDTSDTCRDLSLDNTRQTVNTHDSILDLTRDEEEEDDDVNGINNSILFDDLHTPISEEFEDTVSVITSNKGSDSFFFNAFVDSLCPADNALTQGPCSVSRYNCKPSVSTLSCVPRHRMQLEMDFWNLLGCASSPDAFEVDEIWSWRSFNPVVPKAPKPARANIAKRMQRIHTLRMNQWSGPTRHGVTISTQPHIMGRAHTMDDALAKVIGEGLEPIVSDDGYDSDPEFSSELTDMRSSPRSLLDQHFEDEKADFDEQDRMIHKTVQQTLNSTWTLTWHPNSKNMEEFGVPSKPFCINVWIERGIVISNSGHVVEPTLMWRDAYQADLSKHTLNASTQKPWKMRLLSVCRIAPMSVKSDEYPMARPSCSLLLKTCNGQEFLLETSSPKECEMVCERWKLAVSRFASLAVMEDIDAIATEFFHPTCNSQTLSVNEP